MSLNEIQITIDRPVPTEELTIQMLEKIAWALHNHPAIRSAGWVLTGTTIDFKMELQSSPYIHTIGDMAVEHAMARAIAAENSVKVLGDQNRNLIDLLDAKNKRIESLTAEGEALQNRLDIAQAEVERLGKSAEAAEALVNVLKGWHERAMKAEKALARIVDERNDAERRASNLERYLWARDQTIGELHQKLNDLGDRFMALVAEKTLGDAGMSVLARTPWTIPQESEVTFATMADALKATLVEVMQPALPEHVEEVLNEWNPRIAWEAAAYRALRNTSDVEDGHPFVIRELLDEADRATGDEEALRYGDELDEAMTEVLGWYVPEDGAVECE
jgi:hypothetical protein